MTSDTIGTSVASPQEFEGLDFRGILIFHNDLEVATILFHLFAALPSVVERS